MLFLLSRDRDVGGRALSRGALAVPVTTLRARGLGPATCTSGLIAGRCAAAAARRELASRLLCGANVAQRVLGQLASTNAACYCCHW